MKKIISVVRFKKTSQKSEKKSQLLKPEVLAMYFSPCLMDLSEKTLSGHMLFDLLTSGCWTHEQTNERITFITGQKPQSVQEDKKKYQIQEQDNENKALNWTELNCRYTDDLISRVIKGYRDDKKKKKLL